jgi:hypothetical protein
MGVPFECDLCHFRNVTGRNPHWEDQRDNFTLLCIRRANLDVMWSRAATTVKNNLGRLRQDYYAAMSLFDLRQPLPLLGSPRVVDRVGMSVALIMLKASLRPGKYEDHLQPDSVRKTRTWYNNAHTAGAGYFTNTLYAKDEKKLHATTSVTAGEWFVEVKKNEAFTSKLIVAMTEVAELLYSEESNDKELEKIEELLAFILLEFGAALRGEEVPLTSLKGMVTFWEEATQASSPHVMVTLKGRFKGEAGHRWHCVPIAIENRSRIPFKRWLARLLHRRVTLQGRTGGPLFLSGDGKLQKIGTLDHRLIDLLEHVRRLHPDVLSEATVLTDFSLWRSGRRGATTEAMNNKVDQDTMDLIGRWRKREAARGSEPGMPMRQAYTQVRDTLDRMLVYSSVL